MGCTRERLHTDGRNVYYYQLSYVGIDFGDKMVIAIFIELRIPKFVDALEYWLSKANKQ